MSGWPSSFDRYGVYPPLEPEQPELLALGLTLLPDGRWWARLEAIRLLPVRWLRKDQINPVGRQVVREGVVESPKDAQGWAAEYRKSR